MSFLYLCCNYIIRVAQLLFKCQQKVVLNQMDHPVYIEQTQTRYRSEVKSQASQGRIQDADILTLALAPMPSCLSSATPPSKVALWALRGGKVVVGMYFGLFSGLGLDSMLENKGFNDITLLILTCIPNYSQFIDFSKL